MDSYLLSISLSKSPTDISNVLEKYEMVDGNIIDSFYNTFLIQNMALFKTNSITIPMQERYNMRPDYVSYDYYSTVSLWWLILGVNNILSIIDFNKDNLNSILVPNRSIIVESLSKWNREKSNTIKKSYNLLTRGG